MVRANMTSMGLAMGLLGLFSVGCVNTGVGEPCVPEAIPGDGFTPSEVYVETSAVQCRTRVCIVYHLDGDPENLSSEMCPAGTADCVDDQIPVDPGIRIQDNSINRVFCSCRCRAGEDNPNLPLCACGDGYHCADEGYCVPHEADDSFCSEDYETNCPVGACDLATNRC